MEGDFARGVVPYTQADLVSDKFFFEALRCLFLRRLARFYEFIEPGYGLLIELRLGG